jgi:hypothetical protein
MTSGGQFTADTSAITTAANAFDKEVAPINQTAQKLSGIKGSSSNSGQAYASQGSAYHEAVTSTLSTLITTFGDKTEWMSGALSSTASSYTSSDTSGAQAVDTSGSGLS